MKQFTIADAKQTDLVGYLAFLGHYPDARMSREQEFWYLSPLPGRFEKTPSFKVDRRKGLWFDHGIGKGGSIIDFGMLYHNCNIPDLLERLQAFLSFHRHSFQTKITKSAVEHPAQSSDKAVSGEKKKIRVLSEGPVISSALISYLKQRKIPLTVARHYCREVQYELNDKKYYAIGFPNDAGGYELRNAYFKGSAAPKSIALFDNKAETICVFEGFFSFLSFATIQENQQLTSNILVLNSLSFFDKSRLLMEQHREINLYLDRDGAGVKCTEAAIEACQLYKDCSNLYQGSKDLNEWLINNSKVKEISNVPENEEQLIKKHRGLSR
ncbi:MAG TPA: toprim domain-containing protein [Niabella sp.]|nr:toprim domain-containing protein [Niabella sp.]